MKLGFVLTSVITGLQASTTVPAKPQPGKISDRSIFA